MYWRSSLVSVLSLIHIYHRLMLENTEYIIKGAVAIMKHLGLKKGHIGVEENKPDAIEKLRKVIADMGHSGDIEVNVLREMCIRDSGSTVHRLRHDQHRRLCKLSGTGRKEDPGSQ